MIIDLNGNVDWCEYAKVTVRGMDVETIGNVEFSFIKEALIGFAINLIWLYEDIDSNKEFYVCTDPFRTICQGHNERN